MQDLLSMTSSVLTVMMPLIFILSAIVVAESLVGLLYNTIRTGGRRT